MADQRDGGIAWCDETWNPFRGCTRISTGCLHCYAEKVAARFSGPGQPYEGLATLHRKSNGTTEARWTGKLAVVEKVMDLPLRWKRPRMVFVNSMSDAFHESLSRADIFKVLSVCVQGAIQRGHIFQILTKRAERMRKLVEEFIDMGELCGAGAFCWDQHRNSAEERGEFEEFKKSHRLPWGIWLGVSVENQDAADERLPHLVQMDGVDVKFVSAEPLIGPTNMRPWLRTVEPATLHTFTPDAKAAYGETPPAGSPVTLDRDWKNPIRWVIVGGESGAGARPMDIEWARQIVRDCAEGGTACFVKQLGDVPHEDSGLAQEFRSFQHWVDKGKSWLSSGKWACFDARGRHCPSGREMMRARDEGAFPVRALPLLRLRASKGGDPEEWSPDLRVREYPQRPEAA